MTAKSDEHDGASADHSALVFMVFWNYRLCVVTPPGAVPQGWVSTAKGFVDLH
jgi:hypothetical protein